MPEVYPGVRVINSTPRAIPKAQILAIAESSLIFPYLLILLMPTADITAAILAVIRGLIPRYNPNPRPPKEE